MKGAENEASSSCRSFFSLPFHCCAQNLFVYFFILAEINTVCAADRLPRSFASSTAFLRVAKLANLKGVDESPHRRSSGDRSPRGFRPYKARDWHQRTNIPLPLQGIPDQ